MQAVQSAARKTVPAAACRASPAAARRPSPTAASSVATAADYSAEADSVGSNKHCGKPLDISLELHTH